MDKRDGRQRGFTYLGVLFAVVIMGVVMAATGEVWHVAQTREKETELLFIGNQFRQAIGLFYRAGGTFPQHLEDLLEDPRQPSIQRYLRKIFVDPMTGKPEWGLVKAPNGAITGVYSLSKDTPLKKANFNQADQAFTGATEYDKWLFIYQPRALRRAAAAPPAGATAGAAPGTAAGAAAGPGSGPAPGPAFGSIAAPTSRPIFGPTAQTPAGTASTGASP